jgi:hypothetical protein
MMKNRPDIEFLRQCVAYDPARGVVWQTRPLAHFKRERDQIAWNNHFAGEIAGAVTNGYRMINLKPFRLYEHHIIWALKHGVWPQHELDHINGDRADNRLENLREATRAQNAQNQPALAAHNTSGFAGASWIERLGKWRANIKIGGKQHHLGLFDTAEEAHQAYLEAKAKLHPFQPAQRKAVGG